MQIDYQLTQQDFIDSFAAHRNSNKLSKWIIRLFMSFLILLGVVLALGFLLKPNAQDARSLLPYFGLTFLWVGLVLVLPRWNARRQFAKQPGAQGPRSVVMDSAGVHWRWNGGSADIDWQNYVRVLEGKNQFLLYTSPACFNIVPKRVLSSESLAELRTLLNQNIQAR